MEGATIQSTAAKPSSNRRNTRTSSKHVKDNDVLGGRGKEQQQKQQQQQSRVAQDEENRQNGSPVGKRKPNPSSPARAKKKLHPTIDSPCRKDKSNRPNNSYNNNNSSNATSLQFPVPSSSLSIFSGANTTELQSPPTTAPTLQSNNASASSSLLSSATEKLAKATELLANATKLLSNSAATTNGVATSHSSTNINNELRIDIDSNKAPKLPAAQTNNELTLDGFLSKMEHPDNNIFKHYIVDGKELPRELYKFTGNNVLKDYSFVNESKFEQRAEAEFGDKTRCVRPQTLTAAKVLLCLAMHNSFPPKEEGAQHQVGPLRAGNAFLEERGIHVMSTGPTQSMQFRMFVIALREFWNVPSKTAHVMVVQASLWLESCYNSFHKKAGSKGQEDHDDLVRMLKESADETAECNRDLIVSNKIMDVIVYGGIAQGFVSDNDVIPSGARVYQSPHSCSLVQGQTVRGNCEALIAPITVIKRGVNIIYI